MGGVFAALAEPRAFSQVRVDETGRKIEWPEPRDRHGQPQIDIDAESLYAMLMEQKRDGFLQRMLHAFDRAKARGILDPHGKAD